MQTKALISALEQFREKAKGNPARNGGFTGQKGVFDKAVAALEPFADLRIEDAIAALETANKAKSRKASATSRKSRSAVPLDQALINQYVGALEAAVTSGDFERTRPVLDRLAGDKAIKAADMKAICSAFVGSSAASRKAALARIEQSIRSRILKR